MRALGRHHRERIKAKVRRLLPAVWHLDPTPERVGKNAAVHMRPCSCLGCQRQSRRPDPR